MLKKWIFSLFVLGLIIFSVVYIYPKNINRSINGVEYKLGSNNLKPVQIKIKGKLQRSLFGNKTFVGKIEIKGASYPNQDQNRQLTIEFQENGAGYINYAYYKIGSNETHSYGVLFINKDLGNISIQEFKPDINGGKSWSGDNGLIISGPASSKKKALEIANELMKNYFQDGYKLK